MTAKAVRVVRPLINYTELTNAVDAAITVSYFHDENCGVMINIIIFGCCKEHVKCCTSEVCLSRC